MSSILIKDMDMPKSCEDCVFCQVVPNSLDVYFCYADKNNRHVRRGYNEKPSFCPLAEISTPHGDLIDRDDLLYEINRSTFVERYDYNTAYDAAALAETIIEAEDNE
ncbi:MAG: hypothetical protein IJH40_07220 [Ruminococcus sp.]|uniref:hypothetical protein n=1 Tax=Ruminococcus sp. TaxID=41978 RepID=UPI002872B98D|nr:hypothetical protein [Ruminococcus sp.]MBQ3285416.1 hypothetical protein [Ruminococcus sp.]